MEQVILFVIIDGDDQMFLKYVWKNNILIDVIEIETLPEESRELLINSRVWGGQNKKDFTKYKIRPIGCLEIDFGTNIRSVEDFKYWKNQWKYADLTGRMIHKDADVHPSARIGEGTIIWEHAKVREKAWIGNHCKIGKGVYIDHDVIIRDNVKIQNYACIYFGVEIKDNVFIGPHVCFTNDKFPNASNDNFQVIKTIVEKGSSIGANSTIICGVIIGNDSMIGAGSVVTKDVFPYKKVYGNPAK